MKDKLLLLTSLILFIIGATSGFICFLNTNSIYSLILSVINIYLAVFITKEEYFNE